MIHNIRGHDMDIRVKYLSWRVCLCARSHLTLCDPMDCNTTSLLCPWTICRGLSFPTPGYLSNLGFEPTSFASPALAGGFFTTSATWEAHLNWWVKSIISLSLCDNFSVSLPAVSVSVSLSYVWTVSHLGSSLFFSRGSHFSLYRQMSSHSGNIVASDSPSSANPAETKISVLPTS